MEAFSDPASEAMQCCFCMLVQVSHKPAPKFIVGDGGGVFDSTPDSRESGLAFFSLTTSPNPKAEKGRLFPSLRSQSTPTDSLDLSTYQLKRSFLPSFLRSFKTCFLSPCYIPGPVVSKEIQQGLGQVDPCSYCVKVPARESRQRDK